MTGVQQPAIREPRYPPYKLLTSTEFMFSYNLSVKRTFITMKDIKRWQEIKKQRLKLNE